LDTVLVVEDNWVVLELLRTILQAADLEVLIAPEPTAAVALLRARPVDVIVTDFFSGTSPESCRRSLDGLLSAAEGVPILGVTGRPFDPSVPPSAFGVDEIVSKPFDVDDVVNRVLALLRRRNADLPPES
jgi:DNA-binding response OmpR family regulator